MLSTPITILLVTPVGVLAGYWAGRYAGRKKTRSWRPIFQLIDHRARCLGQTRPRLEHDLGARLAIPPWAWHELLAPRRPLDRRAGHRPGDRP